MKQIFPAVFRTIWKRKETQVYLSFTLFSLVYLIASFFGKSNFIQISIPESQGISNLTFMDIMVNSIDGFILPTLVLYFLTFSVFKKELDDHTMFLYRSMQYKLYPTISSGVVVVRHSNSCNNIFMNSC